MWICKQCDEKLEDSFDACWNCGYEKTGKKIISESFEEIKKENKMTINTKEEKAKELLGCDLLLVDATKIGYCAAFPDKLEFGQFKMFKMVSDGNPPQTVFYEDIADVVVAHGGILNGRFSINKKGQEGDDGGLQFGSRPYQIGLNKKHNDVADKLREYVLEKVKDARSSQKTETSKGSQTISAADELKKYAELKEQGIISQEEFDTKKKELLGL